MVHGAIMGAIFFVILFSYALVFILYGNPAIPPSETYFRTLPRPLDAFLILTGAEEENVGFLLGLLALVLMAGFLNSRVKFYQTSFQPLSDFSAFLMFVFSAKMNYAEIKVIEPLLRSMVVPEGNDEMLGVMCFCFSLIMWTAVFSLIISGLLSNNGVSDQSDTYKKDTITLHALCSALIMAMVMTNIYFH